MSEITTPIFSDAKIQLLTNSCDRARHFLQYGLGESTVIAAQKSLSSIIAVHSNEEWINKVHAAIGSSAYSGNIRLMHANLGIIGDKGNPEDELMIKSWPKYYTEPWVEFRKQGLSPDLILIDGHFQSQCFLYSLLQCDSGTRIIWNDYLNKSEYHFVEKILHPQGLIEDMAIFTVKNNIDRQLANILLFENLFNLDHSDV